ncbi:MAG: hypothetical protein ACK56F_05245 [bacterium]
MVLLMSHIHEQTTNIDLTRALRSITNDTSYLIGRLLKAHSQHRLSFRARLTLDFDTLLSALSVT